MGYALPKNAGPRSNAIYTEAREAATKVWEGIQTFKALQAEWNAGDLGNTLPPGENVNAGLARAQIGSVIFDTADALETVLSAGSATNIQKLL
jgi:hypothetical protein